MKIFRASVGTHLFAGLAHPTLPSVSEPISEKHASGRRRRALLCSTALGAALAFAIPLQGRAADITWTGATSTAWSTSSNWDSGTVPTLADNVTINTTSGSGTVFNPVISSSADSQFVTIKGGFGNVTVNGGFWQSSGIAIGGGSLVIENAGRAVGGSTTIGFGDLGEATVSGANSLLSMGTVQVGDTHRGTLNIMNGGAVSTTGDFTIGSAGGVTGEVTVTGAGSTLAIGAGSFLQSTAGGNAVLTIADGGKVLADRISFNSGGIYIGGGPSSAAAAPGTIDGPSITLGALAGIVFNHTTNGYVFAPTIHGQGSVDLRNGLTVFTADNDYTGTTHIFAGSELQLGLGSAAGAIVGNVVNDGVLAFNRSGTFSYGGSISGTGVVGQSAGTLIFTGTNTYTGNTSVGGGTLLVNGSIASSALTTVHGGATLGGGGTTGNVEVENGGMLSGASGSTLTMANLSLDPGANVNVALGAPSTTGLFNVTNNLTLNGTLNVADAGGFGDGLYRVFDYGGALSGAGFTVGTTPSGYATGDLTVQTAQANQVNLLVNSSGVLPSTSFNFWNGTTTTPGAIVGGSGTWSATGTNWTNANGSANGTYDPSGLLIFTGTGGTVTVDAAGPGSLPLGAGLQFAGNGYVVQGDGLAMTAGTTTIRVGDGTTAGAGYTATIASNLSGVGGLEKTDLGTLVLTGANSYGGGTSVNGGTLKIADGGSISDTSGFVGADAGANGAVAVDGVGSKWTNTDQLRIGDRGTGALNITNGGNVSNEGDGYIGNGSVTVDGAGSKWTNNGTYLFIGDTSFGGVGNGALHITNGGSATFNTVAILGSGAGSNGSVTVDGAGSKWSSKTGTLNVGSIGNGTLAISNGGNVSVAASFIGGDPGSAGTATVDGVGSTWTSTNLMNVGDRGTGTLSISNGGLVSTASMFVGSTGGQGTIVIGGLQGGVVQAPGRLDTPAVNLDATGSVVFQHNDTAGYSFDPQIIGTGALKQVSGTTILTANSGHSANNGTFVGATSVTGGELRVNGSIDSSTVTVSGGSLGGTGTVGRTIVQPGGTVAPGNGGIGTLNVAGDIGFSVGSIYQVEVNAAGLADRIAVNGSATIKGGAVDVLAGSGNYAPSTQYTILTSNGRSGTFDSVSSNLAFLTPALSYDALNVYLTMTRNNTDFGAIGGTPNQRATGTGVESLGYGNPVYDAALNLSAPQARVAFDQLSGEVHASAQSALIADSHFVRDAATNRIRAAFGAVGASSAPVMAYADTTDSGSSAHAAFASLDSRTKAVIAVAPTTDRFALWGQGFGGWGHTDSDGNAARLSHSTGGFVLGGDAPIFDTWRLGMMAGYSRTDFNVKDRASSGTSDNYHLGLYAGTQWGNLGFRSGAAYTWHDISTSRSVAFPGFNDSLKGDYRAGTAQVFGELGYGLHAGRIAFEPFANLAYVNLRTDGFIEKGGAAALTGDGTTTDATFTTLGVHTSTSFDLGGINATARGTLGWRHAFGDVTPDSILSFAGGTPFSIAGTPIAKDAAVVDAGLDFAVSSNAALGLSYNGQFGSGVIDQSVRANFNMTF